MPSLSLVKFSKFEPVLLTVPYLSINYSQIVPFFTDPITYYISIYIYIYISIYSILHFLTIVFPDTRNMKYQPISIEVIPWLSYGFL